eukprot:GHVU01136866.1.p1 GENE.GHVU01136866.1~~GHVU01136866.1.p1  ORF type:complete len:130 (-),score=7.82 GHVU01136866.1:474-863(-)
MVANMLILRVQLALSSKIYRPLVPLNRLVSSRRSGPGSGGEERRRRRRRNKNLDYNNAGEHCFCCNCCREASASVSFVSIVMNNINLFKVVSRLITAANRCLLLTFTTPTSDGRFLRFFAVLSCLSDSA